MLYLDVLLLMNFCIDWMLLSLTAVWRKRMVPRWRLFLGAALGSAYVVFLAWFSWAWLESIAAKALLSLWLVLFVFGFRSLREVLRTLGTFYAVSFLTGGAVFGVYFLLQSQLDHLYAISWLRDWSLPQMSIWLTLSLGLPLTWWLVRRMLHLQERDTVQAAQLVSAHLWLMGRETVLQGYVDTGNQLYDPITRVPVVMVEKTALPQLPDVLKRAQTLEEMLTALESLRDDQWTRRMGLVPLRTVSREGEVCLAVRPDRFKLILQDGAEVEIRRVLIGLAPHPLSPDRLYQMLVHPALLPSPRCENHAKGGIGLG